MTPHQKALFTQKLVVWLVNHPTWPYITKTELEQVIESILSGPEFNKQPSILIAKDQDDFADWLKSIKRRG